MFLLKSYTPQVFHKTTLHAVYLLADQIPFITQKKITADVRNSFHCKEIQ